MIRFLIMLFPYSILKSKLVLSTQRRVQSIIRSWFYYL